MALTRAHAAAELHAWMCNDARFGYSQSPRWGTDGPQVTVTLSDGEQATVRAGSYDCSSSIITAYSAVGVGCGDASYTGNMRPEMTGTGSFIWHDMGDGYSARKGDIYLNTSHHTAMCQTLDSADPAQEDLLSQFRINERGTATGGQYGDQTGGESRIQSYYNYPWNGKLVYTGPERDGATQDTSNASGGSVTYGGGALDVDGYWGAATIVKLQQRFGTPADGIVSTQSSYWASRNPGLTSGWQWVSESAAKRAGGSQLITQLQSWLGVGADGLIGSQTISALQSRMGTPVDGTISTESLCVMEMQRRLNANSL